MLENFTVVMLRTPTSSGLREVLGLVGSLYDGTDSTLRLGRILMPSS
jgi:hypothetical protein